MDYLKTIKETPERGPSRTQRWLFQIVQTRSQKTSQLVTVIKIRQIWLKSYLAKAKKKTLKEVSEPEEDFGSI